MLAKASPKEPFLRSARHGSLSSKSFTKNGKAGPKTTDTIQELFFKKHDEPVFADAAKFLALFAFFAMLFYGLFGLLGIHQLFSYAAGYSAIPILSAFGVNATVVPAGVPGGYPSLTGTSNGVQFTALLEELCGGGLELCVLCAFILGSRDRSFNDRLKGMVLGFIVVAAFNPLRIAITLTLVGTSTLPLVHDLLFRALLVIVLVGTYAAWYGATPSITRP